MQAELAFFEALQSANVSPEKARAAAESLVKEIDRRYELHAKQLATQSDVARLEALIKTENAALAKQIAESQRWTVVALFGGLAALAAIQKLLA